MDYKELLTINDNIEFEVIDGIYEGNYQSKVDDVNDNNIKVLTPFNKGEIVPIRRGTEVNIYYTGEDAVYKISSEVKDRIKDPIPLLVLNPPVKEIERVQRRDYFRLDLIRDVKYARIDKEGNTLEDYKETVTEDISAGGVRIKLEEEEVKEGVLLEMYIDIPELEDTPLEGEIVNIYKNDDQLDAGIKFKELAPNVRDKIMSWLFDKQRELINKGLLNQN